MSYLPVVAPSHDIVKNNIQYSYIFEAVYKHYKYLYVFL